MYKKITLLLFGIILIFSADLALAQGPLGNAKISLNRSLKKTGLDSSLENSIGTVVKGLLSLVGTIFLVLTVWAGIMWMTAQGNDEKVTKAKQIVEAAVIGLFVVMAAYAITSFVTGKLSSSSDGGGGGTVSCNGMGGNCRSACLAGETASGAQTECSGTANILCCY